MRPLLRRALLTAAAAAALCLLPMPSQAQECYYDISAYADASYSEGDGNLYAWGSGADYSSCFYCYHYDYGFDISIKRVATGEVVASVSYYPGGSGETFAPAFAGESYEYGVVFWVACSCAGWIPVGYSNAITVPSPAACGRPANFGKTSSGASAGALHFNYAWGSSTGNRNDLNTCVIGEELSYQPSTWPSPPWTVNYSPGGDHILANTTQVIEGYMSDSHWQGVGWRTPYSAATVVGSQMYWYRCTCYNDNQKIIISGPWEISRSVSQNADGTWKYSISKDGESTNINPLP